MSNATKLKKVTSESSNDTTRTDKTHSKAFIISTFQLLRNPITNFITILTIAIALALPGGLYVLLKNLQTLSSTWDKGAQISLYIKDGTTNEQLQTLINKLKSDNDLASIKYISPEEGLEEFQKTSDFGNILSTLKENPLPAVIIVTPKLTHQDEATINKLVNSFKSMPEIESAQLDLEWAKRLGYFISLGGRILSGIFVLLSIGLILIISNTISLTTHFAIHKITTSENFSGKKFFVYRVFLYKGFWLGVFGSLLAWLFIDTFLSWLSGPITQLTTAYNSNFILKPLSWADNTILIFVGISLGLLGAWLGIFRHSRSSNN